MVVLSIKQRLHKVLFLAIHIVLLTHSGEHREDKPEILLRNVELILLVLLKFLARVPSIKLLRLKRGPELSEQLLELIPAVNILVILLALFQRRER